MTPAALLVLSLSSAPCGQYGHACATAAPSYGYQYQAPSYGYQYQSYQAPSYGYGYNYYAPPYNQVYLGYASPASYVGYMAQATRAAAAEQEREQLSADVKAIKEYLKAASAPQPAPLTAPPPPPGKSAAPPPNPGLSAPAPNPGPVPAPGETPPNAPTPADDQAPPPPTGEPAGKGIRGGAPVVIRTAGAETMAVLVKRCFDCHAAGKEDAGGGFVMFKDKQTLADLDPFTVDLIDKRVKAGTMPPKNAGGRLPAAERAAVAELADDNAPAIARALASARAAAR